MNTLRIKITWYKFTAVLNDFLSQMILDNVTIWNSNRAIYLKSKSTVTIKKFSCYRSMRLGSLSTFGGGVKFTLFWVKFIHFPVKFSLFSIKFTLFSCKYCTFSLSNPLNPDGLINGVLPCRFTGRLGSLYWFLDWIEF